MGALESRGLVPVIQEYAASARPLLGICLGMQALLDGSEEDPGRRRAGTDSRPGGSAPRLRAENPPHWVEQSAGGEETSAACQSAGRALCVFCSFLCLCGGRSGRRADGDGVRHSFPFRRTEGECDGGSVPSGKIGAGRRTHSAEFCGDGIGNVIICINIPIVYNTLRERAWPAHVCQTNYPLSGYQGRPRGQGRELSRPAGCGRPGRGCETLLR